MVRSGGSASPAPEEPKQEGSRSEQLEVKVVDANQQEVIFKIKTRTKFGKVFELYCARQEIDRRAVRFLLDGHRIQENDTPESLEMENGDMIQCVLEQLGGEGTPAVDEPKPEEEAPTQLNVKVCDQGGQELFFKIKIHTQLKKVMNAYCERQAVARGLVRFLFEGERIQDNDTPESLSMEDGDMIQVFVEQHGGEGTEADEDADPVKKHIL